MLVISPVPWMTINENHAKKIFQAYMPLYTAALYNQTAEFQINTRHLPTSLKITYYLISPWNLTLQYHRSNEM